MIALDDGDKIQGDTTTASKVDYTLHGVVGTTITQLADGQLPSNIGDLYTASGTVSVLAIVLVNTHTSVEAVNLYLTPSGGTARRLIPKDMSLGIGHSLHTDGKTIRVLNASGQLLFTTQVAHLNDIGDVSVPTPADNDLFYYDAATGLWKPRKLVDADIPAGICRDAEADAKVAAHAALTTGVHGVGEKYIASIRPMGFEALALRKRWCSLYDFTHWAESVTGSGIIEGDPFRLYVSTGATANSTARAYFGVSWCDYALLTRYDRNRYMSFLFRVENIQTTGKIRVLAWNNAGGGSLTDKGFGFLIDGTALKGIVHNGTSETTVDLDMTVTKYWTHLLEIEFLTGDKIRWLVNGVEKGTSENIPSGVTHHGYLVAYVENGATDDSVAARIHGFNIITDN